MIIGLAILLYIVFVLLALALIFSDDHSSRVKEEADRQFEIRRSIADAYIASANARTRQMRREYEKEEGDE
jgi:hypothetical protein